jgi:hypothetical protein
MGTARSIASLVWTGLTGGSKLLIKSYLAIRRGRSDVKKSARILYKQLVKDGIPSEDAKEIAVAYAKPAWEFLHVRSLIKMATEMGNK